MVVRLRVTDGQNQNTVSRSSSSSSSRATSFLRQVPTYVFGSDRVSVSQNRVLWSIRDTCRHLLSSGILSYIHVKVVTGRKNCKN